MFARILALHPFRRPLLALLLALATALPALVAAPPAGAAVCTVTSPLNDGYGSLRLLLANASCTTIDFGVPEVRVSSYLTINRSVTIQGKGIGGTAIRYAGDFSYTGSVIFISAGTVAINDLTVAGGRTISLWGAGIGIVGRGAVPTVTLTRVKVTDNVAREGGGGGIYASNATLNLVNSRVVANSSPNYVVNDGYGGGGIFLDDNAGNVSAILTDTEVVNNAAYNNFGGGIRVWHRAYGKTAQLMMGGGSIRFNSGLWGGGILNGGGTVTLRGTTVSGNAAGPSGGGGGIYNYAGQFSVNNSIVTDNTVGVLGDTRPSHGGGLYNYVGSVTVSGSIVSGNTVYNDSLGGGIFNNQGTMQVDTTTIEGNGAGGQGGGIYSDGGLSIDTSTITGNRAGQIGGGLRLGGNYAQVRNTTISGNNAGRYGGGIVAGSTRQPITLTAVTLIGNINDNDYTGNAAGLSTNTPVQVRQSLIVGNFARGVNRDCNTLGTTIQSLGDNLARPGAGCPTNATGDVAYTGPLDTLVVGTLANNGGPTRTHNLVPGGAAVDRVPAARCAFYYDQRNFARPQGTGCDIGAVEYRP